MAIIIRPNFLGNEVAILALMTHKYSILTIIKKIPPAIVVLSKFLTICFFVFASLSANAASSKCENLFLETRGILEINGAAPSEELILLQIDALVELYYKIQTQDFPNEDQLKQSIEHFNFKMKQIIGFDAKYEDVFKTRHSAAILKTRAEQKKAEEKSKKEREEKERIIKETKDSINPVNLSKKIVFHEIKPGKFLMGEPGQQVKAEITKPFAMMETQMTQMMWARLMIAIGHADKEIVNPSHFKTGEESILVKDIDGSGIDIQMKPDHPIENISWNDVEKLLDGLNTLSNLDDAKTQAFLEKLIPGHKKGDVYDFPTEAQWEFVMRDRGRAKKKYFDRGDGDDLSKHAWFDKNSKNEEYSNGSTHAVATKQARIIDDRPFYDLEGNVREWIKDSWDGISKIPGGKDPLGTAGSYRVVRGGSWYSGVQDMRSGFRNYYGPGVSCSSIGLRLVRTRP